MDTPAKIMIVDDENRICRNVEKILARNNYQVVTAESADEALEKLAQDSYALLISDIVMPGTNGLELLKLVKSQWPLTKAVMMTAYASTDTAVKAIRLGALDYIAKPFTPDELRSTVERALSGDLEEAEIPQEEREAIELIDVDVPFVRDEVAEAAGEAYADMLGPSDMPVVEVKAPEALENFCEVGNMVCDIFKKLGATCKAGTKTGNCPQLAKKARQKKAAAAKGPDVRTLIGIDEPFDYREVVSVTGPEYVANLRHEGVAFLSYEELKLNVARLDEKRVIDVDMPFDCDEVREATGEGYTDRLTRSDVPVVEVKAPEALENFCEVGNMVCDIFKKLGATCKAGTKTGNCPQLAKKARQKKAAAAAGPDMCTLVGIDLPFAYDEVAAAAGPEYARQLVGEDLAVMPYERLKARITELDEQERRRREALVASVQKPAHPRILVIDDEVAVNNNIRRILQKKGYQVDQAVTRDEALSRIADGGYGLVLLDLKIPGVQGLELLETVRDRCPDARVIMITGYASIETAVEAARLGAVDYLPKPFTPGEIRRATENALRLAA